MATSSDEGDSLADLVAAVRALVSFQGHARKRLQAGGRSVADSMGVGDRLVHGLREARRPPRPFDNSHPNVAAGF
jgi:hypothetical protein